MAGLIAHLWKRGASNTRLTPNLPASPPPLPECPVIIIVREEYLHGKSWELILKAQNPSGSGSLVIFTRLFPSLPLSDGPVFDKTWNAPNFVGTYILCQQLFYIQLCRGLPRLDHLADGAKQCHLICLKIIFSLFTNNCSHKIILHSKLSRFAVIR